MERNIHVAFATKQSIKIRIFRWFVANNDQIKRLNEIDENESTNGSTK